MRQLNLKLTLREDLVANDGAATEGGHAGLDYLPGILLLGAAAARLYANLSRADAYRLFHSGEVRFGDALPLVDDHPGWPVPLCWHERKGDPAEADGRLVPGKVRNLQFGRFQDEGVQPKQLRADYVRADGRRLKVNRSLRMKTAIDPRTGRVAEAQLFGYQSIDAGQVFAARIQAPDTLPADLWERLTEALTQDCELLLGRSRSAEYGRVLVESLADGFSLEPTTDPKASRQLTLWCLSDLALLDDWGQETLTPEPKALGLKRGAIDWERTFLRFRHYAVWNAYRNGFDLERQVIQRGSVIALKLDEGEAPWTTDERAGLAAGVGLYREAGLGWLVPDPLLLGQDEPTFAEAFDEIPKTSASRPDYHLLNWLEAGTKGATDRSTAEGTARRYRDELKERYRLARAFAGVPDTLPIGPSPAQWGSVYEAARTADSQDLAGLKAVLFVGQNGQSAICKLAGEGWQDQFRDDRGVRTFRDWLSSQFDGTPQPTVVAMRFFAREAMRVAKGVHGRGEREQTQPTQEKTR